MYLYPHSICTAELKTYEVLVQPRRQAFSPKTIPEVRNCCDHQEENSTGCRMELFCRLLLVQSASYTARGGER